MHSVTEILTHLVKVCVRNDDGSLTLGTYEVGLLEKALTLSSPPPLLHSICDEDAEDYDTKGQSGGGSFEDDF